MAENLSTKDGCVTNDIRLNGHHRVTLEALFRHPVGHNIEWHDAMSLLEKVGTVVEEPNGRFAVTVGSDSRIFDKPRGHDIDTQQVLDLRRMLDGAGITPESVGKG